MIRRWGIWMGIVLAVLALAGLLALQTPTGQRAYNVADFRFRHWRVQHWGKPTVPSEGRGGLTGRVMDTMGQPIEGAIVLVAEATGETYHDATDGDGRYRITGVPAGRYVPLAAAWGYRMRIAPSIRVRPGATVEAVDFALPPRPPIRLSAEIPVTITGRTIVTGTFPSPDVEAERIDFRFERAGTEIAVDRIYQPVGRRTPGPTLAIAFPSYEPHWEPAAVAFASQGFTVLFVAPVAARGLDIQAHALDLLQAVTLLRAGRLTPAADPDRMAVLAGSFSTLYFYQVLPDMPEIKAVITVGGISDAFLGVQALYDETLEIPPPYDAAIAAIGRPDRHPERFMQYSPAFFARHMPPTLVVHTTADRVIPYNQSVRFAQALADANVPHDLILYEDTSHYLNTWNPTPQVTAAFWRMIDFLQSTIGEPSGE
ncbi:MAG: prolyl oligopeptidase family serine peptidase [Chloroflexi bacterium]|nr:prolyl oligopeptidase family serine peptidase [Chloroflexota bacterium]